MTNDYNLIASSVHRSLFIAFLALHEKTRFRQRKPAGNEPETSRKRTIPASFRPGIGRKPLDSGDGNDPVSGGFRLVSDRFPA